MSKVKNTSQYKNGRIGEFASVICEKYKLDPKEVKAILVHNFPELKDKSHCANCGESMSVYSFSITNLDAMLLAQMGKIVFERIKAGIAFTEANKIHISAAIKGTNSSRQTIASKLGLITKVKKEDGTHDREAGWLITRRGFEFLSGKPVPAKVNVFRNKITERFDELTTIDKVTQHSADFVKFKDVPFSELEHYSIVGFAQPNLI